MIITHAFTLCPLYAEAILSYGKDVENRSWRLPEDFIGVPLALHVGKRNPMVLIVPGGDVAPGSKNSSQYGEDCPGSRLPIRSGGSSPQHGEHAVFPGFPPVGSITEALPVIPLELQERKHQPPAVVRPWEKGGSHPLAKAAGL